MTTIYFTNHQKATARRLFKEVSMRYLCKKCLECEFQKSALKQKRKKCQHLNTEIQ